MVKPLNQQSAPPETAGAEPDPTRLSGADVRAITFRKPRFGHRGYDEEQVDIFLDWVADSLDAGEPIPPARVHDVSFGKPGLNRRGYREQDVDAFLSRIEAAARHAAR
ncbi:MAG TPA: DivIVA domain-containing protein [Jatrophihabitans sp.]|nr:DivIVA domain-containing protein [Jatrophihabitans sp.]